LPVMEVLAYLKALCSALGFCHANGVVHGNLIPSNIMVDQGGTVYLTDFFSVWHAESTLKALWMPGNPAYMAPEQILGQPVSPATDIYGLGWLSYEMLAGRWPFNGQEPTPGKEFGTHIERMRYACLNLLPPNPRQFNRDISAELASVFLRSLAKDPRERFLSCPEFLASACHAAGTDPDLVPDRVALVGPNAKNAVK
jgi:serine/threonine protein kinase